MQTRHCALFEGHSWPEAGDPQEALYGYRQYRLDGDECSYQVDVLHPWESIKYPCKWIFIADELCDSKLPFYVPRRNRVGLFKESPMHLSSIDLDRCRHRFLVVFTHLKAHLELGPPFRFLPYSSNFLGISVCHECPVMPPASSKTSLCSFIGNLGHARSSPGYSLRRDVYNIIQNNPMIESYGRDIRPIQSKREGLDRFAFSIAMENTCEDYYFTEKLIDCFLTCTVPIYWGCPSIGKFFDPEGILSFSTAGELSELVNGLSMKRYYQLRGYVERNFVRTVQEDLADFHGYLQRALLALPRPGFTSASSDYRLSYGLYSKAMAKVRKLLHR